MSANFRSIRLVLFGYLAWVTASAAPAQLALRPADPEATSVVFLSPAAGEPLFGPSTIELRVESTQPVRTLVLRMDGVPVAQQAVRVFGHG